jgi:nucleotide-binding universal stress UspA family protein
MKQLKTILYATDFSDSSAVGAETALYLAKLGGAHLHVLHVISEFAAMQRTMIPPSAFLALEKEIEVQAVVQIEAFCRKHFGEQVMTETHTTIGIPFKEIMAKAAEIKADLIIIGTHGSTGIEHVIVGSTAERLLRRATKIPVLAVPCQ